MEQTKATQENYNRSRNNPQNVNIYFYLKEDDLAQLTDEEFEILQTKLKPVTSAPTNASFHDFCEGPDANGLKGDETTLNIFKRAMAAHRGYHSCFSNYSRVFSFCRRLNITNLYDIGCGNQLQSFLLICAPDMNYTGIDRNIFHDYPDNFMAEPAYINELFEQFTGGGRIRYIKQTYPFDLAAPENNIAILLNCFCRIDADEKEWANAAAHISRDFERVLFNITSKEYNLAGVNIKDIVHSEVEIWVNPFEKYYSLWKNALPGFEFYKIGEPNVVFGTKVPEDGEKLKKHYTIVDNRVMTGAIDIPWHQELMNS